MPPTQTASDGTIEKMATLLNTRPQNQATALNQLLAKENIDFISYPTLIIKKVSFSAILTPLWGKKCPLPTWHKCQGIYPEGYVFFISRNAVSHFLSEISDPQAYFQQTTIYAIGKATFEALAEQGISATCSPPPFNSDSVLKLLPNNLAGQSCWIIKGQGGLDDLASGLIQKNARLTEIECYKRVASPFNISAWSLFKKKENGMVLITSLESIASLFATIPKQDQINLRKKTAIVFSERIKNSILKQGWLGQIKVTAEQSNQSIIDEIQRIKT